MTLSRGRSFASGSGRFKTRFDPRGPFNVLAYGPSSATSKSPKFSGSLSRVAPLAPP